MTVISRYFMSVEWTCISYPVRFSSKPLPFLHTGMMDDLSDNKEKNHQESSGRRTAKKSQTHAICKQKGERKNPSEKVAELWIKLWSTSSATFYVSIWWKYRRSWIRKKNQQGRFLFLLKWNHHFDISRIFEQVLSFFWRSWCQVQIQIISPISVIMTSGRLKKE